VGGGRRVCEREKRKEEKEKMISRRGHRVRRGNYELSRMEINDITSTKIEESIYIHRELGPGLLESVYEEVLYYRPTKRGLHVTRQQGIPVIFGEVKMEMGFRAGLILEEKVICGIKIS
jgi:hypothetical protein